MYAIEFSLSQVSLWFISLSVFATARVTHQPKATQVLSKEFEFNFELHILTHLSRSNNQSSWFQCEIISLENVMLLLKHLIP